MQAHAEDEIKGAMGGEDGFSYMSSPGNIATILYNVLIGNGCCGREIETDLFMVDENFIAEQKQLAVKAAR